MGLDEPRHRDVAELMSEHRSADDLGAKLGGGEAGREGEQRPADGDAEGRMFRGESYPDGAEH